MRSKRRHHLLDMAIFQPGKRGEFVRRIASRQPRYQVVDMGRPDPRFIRQLAKPVICRPHVTKPSTATPRP